MTLLTRIQNNCRQATFLIEKKSLTRLTFRETVELRIHLTGCSFCRLFGKQSAVINQMVRELLRASDQPNIRLDDEFKKELQDRIERELKKD